MTKYLQEQHPGLQLVQDWKSDIGARRFYFVEGGKNRYVLQISEEAFADSTLPALKAKLEKEAL